MLKRYLAHEFKTKNFEKLQNFWGIEVAQSLKGIVPSTAEMFYLQMDISKHTCWPWPWVTQGWRDSGG